MYISRHMKRPPITVTPETLLPAVRALFDERGFRHLPVVNRQGELVGMITDRDLRSAYPSSILPEEQRRAILAEVAETQVASVMSTSVISLAPSSTLDDALHFFSRDKMGLLPVVDEQRRVIGVFSIQDLMQAYKTLYGIGDRGSALVAVADDGKPKPLTRIVRLLEELDVRFSRLSRVKGENGGGDIIYLRVHTFNLSGVHRALKEIGLRIVTPGS